MPYLAHWATQDDADAQNDDHDFTAYEMAHPCGIVVRDTDAATVAHLQAMALAEFAQAIHPLDPDEDDPLAGLIWTRDEDGSHVYYLESPISGDDDAPYAVMIIQEAVEFT